MKAATILAAFAAAATEAHYVFPAIVYNGVQAADWTTVRQWTNSQSNGPLTDVTTSNLRCNVDADKKSAPVTTTVAAGSKLSFVVKASISHPGPMLFYMAKVPAGKTAATFDGSGNVWFKIQQDEVKIGSSLSWPNAGATSVDVKIPASLPAGDYLLRAEHIALHSASSVGGAQLYISCAQLTVTGGGSGSPSPLVAFPGAYNANDPGLKINIYYPIPTSYTPPGPAVWNQ